MASYVRPSSSPVPRLIARSMASLVICPALAFSIAVRSVALELGSPPPSRAATSSCLAILAKSWPRALSAAPFLCLMVAHFEWPDMAYTSCKNLACSRASPVSSG